MERTLIQDLPRRIDEVVRIQGWVQAIRDQKKMQFLIIRDRTGLVQAILEKKEADEKVAILSGLTVESAVELSGKVIQNKQVKLGQLEILIEEIRVHNVSPPQLPIDEESSLDLKLDWRFLDLRRPANYLIFQVQTTVEQAMRNYWMAEGFIEIHSPKFMGSASESGAELFRVDYFGKSAYLAQSPQFYKQMAMAAGFDRVFEIGPVFRANPSFTSRHDTEFTSVDVEMAWIESHEDLMAFEERWLRAILETVRTRHGDDIQKTFGVTIQPPEIPFPRITMKEAHEILRREGWVPTVEGKGDLDPEGERRLSRYVQEKYGHEFVFVTDYPITVRPFYHMRDGNPPISKSFDLIWKGLEVTTGAQREHRYERLVHQAEEKGLRLEPIEYYLNCFKYGCPPHGGFGFGLTRMLMILLNAKNVREVTYLYRGPNRLAP